MTAHTTGLYRHPDAAIRAKQEKARKAALAEVQNGYIHWGRIEGRGEGFRYRLSSDRIEQRNGIEVLIALYELRDAGRITVDTRSGVVRLRSNTTTDRSSSSEGNRLMTEIEAGLARVVDGDDPPPQLAERVQHAVHEAADAELNRHLDAQAGGGW